MSALPRLPRSLLLLGIVAGVFLTLALSARPAAADPATAPTPFAETTAGPAQAPTVDSQPAGTLAPLPPPAADPYAGVSVAPTAAPQPERPNPPFYQKWWFWTAVGVFAVTTVVIVLASSAPGAPKTDLGNMPAF